MMAIDAWRSFIWTVVVLVLFVAGGALLRDDMLSFAVLTAFGLAMRELGRTG